MQQGGAGAIASVSQSSKQETEIKKMAEKEKIPVWGYRKSETEECGYEGKIFETTDGKLPDGWKDTFASFKKD